MLMRADVFEIVPSRLVALKLNVETMRSRPRRQRDDVPTGDEGSIRVAVLLNFTALGLGTLTGCESTKGNRFSFFGLTVHRGENSIKTRQWLQP